ncbi:SRPBCC domain-containing protein [Sphingosinicella sp. BN140058]|uniref:SRPBCC family protein n=1 Tax=Sphingosinicella sp. BN140058 TaxID=1892855 RepID=UPI0010139498|nr:SRPBCC domain-containing protein [Sphingosinicella sp. BN140058]QAY75991.1 SRPBCC domain-containing protein [Sphingosinicella sp. BN140058]
MTDQIESSLVVERTYAATVEELWTLWTTKEGFESWWGPEQFRADVHTIEPRPGGALHYDMVADTPEAIAAMERMNAPTSQPCRGAFTTFEPYHRLVLTQLIDFLPGVEPYDSRIAVDFFPGAEGHVRMVVTLSQMHDAATSAMQREGFTSQLSKLDRRYGQRA